MSTIRAIKRVILGGIVFFISTGLFASTTTQNNQGNNPVTGAVHATGQAINAAGQTSVKIIKGTVKGAKNMVNGMTKTTKKVVTGKHAKNASMHEKVTKANMNKKSTKNIVHKTSTKDNMTTTNTKGHSNGGDKNKF